MLILKWSYSHNGLKERSSGLGERFNHKGRVHQTEVTHFQNSFRPTAQLGGLAGRPYRKFSD